MNYTKELLKESIERYCPRSTTHIVNLLIVLGKKDTPIRNDVLSCAMLPSPVEAFEIRYKDKTLLEDEKCWLDKVYTDLTEMVNKYASDNHTIFVRVLPERKVNLNSGDVYAHYYCRLQFIPNITSLSEHENTSIADKIMQYSELGQKVYCCEV